MPSKPVSSGVSDDAFDMGSYGREPVISRPNSKTVEAVTIEEHEAKHKGATVNDQKDMDRLGKKQELRVRWSF